MASVEQLELYPRPAEDEPNAGDRIEPRSKGCSSLMARVLERDNLMRALKQVKRNKGAPGVDGVTVEAFPAYLQQYWPSIRAQLVVGRYRPKPVRRVEIPKLDGRKRKLGIPTVVDRFIQQAIAHVLQAQWEVRFHEHRYGFRPCCSAHQYIRHAQTTIKAGYCWFVSCDLDAFFDRVNHDVLRLINRYMKAAVRILSRRTRGHSLFRIIADLK